MGRSEGAFSVYSRFHVVLYAIELSKTDPFYMDIETHGILLQNVYSVLPLQFTSLMSKALKAYDLGNSYLPSLWIRSPLKERGSVLIY